MQKEHYNEGKLPNLWQHLVELHQKEPRVFESPEVLRTIVALRWTSLKDKRHCPNCGAGMVENVYTASLHTGLLLFKMAKEVRDKVGKGVPFTEANLVHVPSLVKVGATEGTTKGVAIAQYLNFVHQPESKKNSGFYVITNWGWSALAGKPVPKWVKVWRGQIVERSQETTTLAEMFRTHMDKVNAAVVLGKKIRSDYRTDVRDYYAPQWAQWGEVREGAL